MQHLKDRLAFSLILVILIFNLSGCNIFKSSQNIQGPLSSFSELGATVEFLNVGQADSIYISLPDGKNALIDAGNNGDGRYIVSYLKGKGIRTIDYLFGTHPHEDHIGGLDDIIEEFIIGQIFMPRIDDSDIPTTKTYENILDAMIEKGYQATAAKTGMTAFGGNGYLMEILAPGREKYSNLNNYSIVLKLTCFGKTFLFMGDAEAELEKEIFESNISLQADVIKVGHHGSKTSSLTKFINATSPKYAIISVGKNNTYNLPNEETLNTLQSSGAQIMRTDICGTIICRVSDNEIAFTYDTQSVLDSAQRG